SRAEQLAVRVGIHVGEPIRDEDDYFGLPVHVAKRICDAASGGQIVASDVVRALIGARASSWIALPALDLRGVTDPVSAYEIPWLAPPDNPLPLPAALDRRQTTFVGRTEGLAALGAWWERALRNEFVFGAITGEPGIGKTSLLAEFAAAAKQFGASVLFGRC